MAEERAPIDRAIRKIVATLSRTEIEAVLIALDEAPDGLVYDALAARYRERFPLSAEKFFEAVGVQWTARHLPPKE